MTSSLYRSSGCSSMYFFIYQQETWALRFSSTRKSMAACKEMLCKHHVTGLTCISSPYLTPYLWEHCCDALAPECLRYVGGHEVHLLLPGEPVVKHCTVTGTCGQNTAKTTHQVPTVRASKRMYSRAEPSGKNGMSRFICYDGLQSINKPQKAFVSCSELLYRCHEQQPDFI